MRMVSEVLRIMNDKKGLEKKVHRGEVLPEDEDKREADASELLFQLNNSRLAFLFDPLKRLQAFELAMIFSGLVIAFCAFFEWWIASAILLLNHAVITWQYFKERKAYKESGGVL